MMKKLFAIIFLCSTSALSAQTNNVHIYDWEEVQHAQPDTIYGISLEKLKLDTLPTSLSKFKHLQYLDLGKNRLTELPDFIGDFKELKELNVQKNNLTNFPVQVCRMANLERLILNRNAFESIPPCIEYATNLRYLDIYDSPVKHLPESLTHLKQLEEIDFSGIRYNEEFQTRWRKLLPKVKLVFDPPCNCI